MSNKLIADLMSFQARMKADARSSVMYEGDYDTISSAISELKKLSQSSKVEPAPSNMDMRAAFEKYAGYLNIKRFADKDEYVDGSIQRDWIVYQLAWQAAISQATPALVATWQPIDTAPKDNKRPLYLARINSKGELQEIDLDGTWELTSNGGEDYNEHSWHDWHSASGIEEPTHWAYQDEPIPPAPTQEQRVEPFGYVDEYGNFEQSLHHWMKEEPNTIWKPVYDHPPQATEPAQEPDFDLSEWLITEVSALPCSYAGDPQHDYDAYYMQTTVIKLIEKHRELFTSPQPEAG